MASRSIAQDAKAFLRKELTGRKLVWNIIWHGLHCFLFAYGWYSQYTNARLAALNGLKYSVWTSRGAGLVLAFDEGLILVPMLRNIIRLIRPKLQWLIPADENIWFHRQVAYQLLFWTVVHTTAHYVNFINVERTQVRKQTAWEIHYAQAGGITGHTMLLIMFLMYTTAHRSIRKQCFEAFWYTHHLAFFFMIALYTHATGCFVRDSVEPDYTYTFPFYSTDHCLGYESWRFIIWVGILYFAERVYRIYRSRLPTRLLKVLQHPSGVIELRFEKKSMKGYKAGQWCFLNVPDVAGWEWHPFTISSAPEDPYISLHIRQVGDFTRALAKRLGADEVGGDSDGHGHGDHRYASRLNPGLSQVGIQQSGMYELELDDKVSEAKDQTGMKILEVDLGDGDGVEGGGAGFGLGRRGEFVEVRQDVGRGMPVLRVDGPYGAPAEDVFNSEVAVLVAAGIGVTPFASILKHIWYRQRAGRLGRLRRVEFIWSCRDTGSFGWVQSLLEEIEAAQTDPNFLRISIYLTQKLEVDAVQNIAINDVGQEFDPLTLLRSRTLFGRPSFSQIFTSLCKSINGGSYLPGREATLRTRLGVYYCGPNALARTIRTEAIKCRSESIDVTFAKEHF